jgi:hypothetical protein
MSVAEGVLLTIVKILSINYSSKYSISLHNSTPKLKRVSEKLDSRQSGLKTVEAELFRYRMRVNELKAWLSKDQRTLPSTENQYGNQLTE